MTGPFRRFLGARRTPADPPAPHEGEGPASAPDGYTEGHAIEEPTAVLDPAESSHEELDALVGQPPSSRRRGRLRRRLRHLRRVREVLMRDLGGFVFEVHRAGADGTGGPVAEAKLRRLAAVDAELRELEAALEDHRPLVVREAGIGGACPGCGELYGSDARFCWACGTPVAAGAGHVPELPAGRGSAQIEAAPAAEVEAAPAEAHEPATAEAGEPVPDGDPHAWIPRERP